MPYQKSKARKAFDVDIDSCIDVVRQLQASTIRNPSIRDYVLSNAILKTSAEIEAYFEDLISDWLAELNGAPRQTQQIPAALRVRHFVTGAMLDVYRRYIVFDDENQFATSFAALLGSAEMSFGPDGLACPALNPMRILEGRKYPSPKNIAVLFGRLGVPTVFDRLNASARADMKLVLESFNGIRGSLAHVGWPVAYNANDVKRLLRSMKVFIGHVDRVFYSHVVAVSGAASWRV